MRGVPPSTDLMGRASGVHRAVQKYFDSDFVGVTNSLAIICLWHPLRYIAHLVCYVHQLQESVKVVFTYVGVLVNM